MSKNQRYGFPSPTYGAEDTSELATDRDHVCGSVCLEYGCKCYSRENEEQTPLGSPSGERSLKGIMSQSDRFSGSEANFLYTLDTVKNYMETRKIYELFNFMLGHLLVERPDEPINFLIKLLDECLLFRSGLMPPPFLFNSNHINAVVKAFDPGESGSMTLSQYKKGLTTLGIVNYNSKPPRAAGRISNQVFKDEAEKRLTEMLRSLLEC